MDNSITDVTNELDTIKEMLEKTKRKAVDNGFLFLLWGWLAIAACLITYGIAFYWKPELSWLPWAVLMPIGAVITIIVSVKSQNNSKYTTYAEHAYGNVWFGCGLAFFIAGFVTPFSTVLNYTAIYIIISIIAGIGVFASGGILEWTLLRIGGLFWWAAAIIMMFTPFEYHPLIMGLVIIPGYLLPGYILKSKYKTA